MLQFLIYHVKKADIENVMKCLKRTYFIDEPLIKTLKYCNFESDYCPDLEDYCRNALSEISLIATDFEGNIIGVLLNTIGLVNDPIGYQPIIDKCESWKVKKFLRVIAAREPGADLPTKYPDDKEVFEIKIAATDRAWRNKGVMKKLMEEADKTAIRLGIRLIRIDTSSCYSAKAAEKNGFTCVYKQHYTDITEDGEPIIVPDPPHTMDRVFIKELF